MAYDKKCWTYIVLKRRPIDDLKRICYTCEQYEVETSCDFTEMFISYSKIDRAEYVYFGIYASEQQFWDFYDILKNCGYEIVGWYDVWTNVRKRKRGGSSYEN